MNALQRTTRLAVPVVLAAALAIAAVCHGQESDRVRAQAEQILKQTGFQGGLIVDVGCGRGELTAALGAAGRYLVQGLDRDPRRVQQARKHIASLGRYGRTSARQLSGDRLPYATGMVNLVVVERPDQTSTKEVRRVLSPGGVAYIQQDNRWSKTVKPRRQETDEWTHVLHGPDGNAVADDTVVGPPRHVQWVGPPRQARAHEHLASISVLVSAGGRIFSIEDEGPAASVLLPPKWFLVARDAFNGVELWKMPVGPWQSPLTPFRQGPVTLSRRLIAIGDRVYATTGFGKPLQSLDAATGRTLHTYEATQGTTEVLYRDGLLFLVVGKGDAPAAAKAAQRRGKSVPPGQQQIRVIWADTGKLVWNKADADTDEALPMTLVTNGKQVFFQNPDAVICLDAETGRQQWRAERPVARMRPPWSAPTLVVYDDVVLSADRATPDDVGRDPSRVDSTPWIDAPRGDLIALSARTGESLWSAPCREGYHAPVDVLVAGGLVWTGELASAREPGFTAGRDPHSGEIKRRRPADDTFFQIGMPHHRCYRNRATNRYLVLGRAGVELVDIASGKAIANHWVRGTCQFGVLPCNGLIYLPPHACACYIDAKLNGFYALAPRGETAAPPETPDRGGLAGEDLSHNARDAGRLERGPAYARLQKRQRTRPNPDDWPTYRHDAARSGHTPAAVSHPLKRYWRTRVSSGLESRAQSAKESARRYAKPAASDWGPALTSLVAADGRVFVASPEDHTVDALDARNGTILWQTRVGGRVDSPPTVYQGLVLFGSADGSVYCLDAATGDLVWRFRGAAEQRQVVAYGQLESTWPIHGSVLVERGTLVFAAGRSSYLDGGIYFYRLDPRTGAMLSRKRLTSRNPATGGQPEVIGMFDLPGLLPDVLSSDDQRIYMRHAAFDQEGNRLAEDHAHLFCPTGFLDSAWWHRSYWVWSTRFYSGYRDWFRAGREAPAGRPLVLDKTSVYGFARKPEYFYWSTPQEYQLFASSKDPGLVASPVKRNRLPAWGQRQIRYTWTRDIPVQARAMVLAGATLFVAGPPKLINEKEANARPNDPRLQVTLNEQAMALAGRDGGLLWAVSAEDGSKLVAYPLDSPPVWDGMIAAGGYLFFATADGSVVCFGPR